MILYINTGSRQAQRKLPGYQVGAPGCSADYCCVVVYTYTHSGILIGVLCRIKEIDFHNQAQRKREHRTENAKIFPALLLLLVRLLYIPRREAAYTHWHVITARSRKG